MSGRLYILFDSRAWRITGATRPNEASVIETCTSLRDAERRAARGGVPCACYSFADDAGVLREPRWEFDHYAKDEP